MKKIVIIAAAVLAGVAVIRVGTEMYRRSNPMELAGEGVIKLDGGETDIERASLVATAETRAAAEEIAELYGITLVSYELKVAVYSTDKDPMELIQMGAEKGYPAIGINNSFSINNKTN